MYRSLIKPLLFRFDPEKIHYAAMAVLKFFYKLPGGAAVLRICFSVGNKNFQRQLLGLTFPNPVGLAAGFDKDARWFNELACVGFGFVEIGTVTPLPQPGNDKPRLFRLPKDEAIVNRMGFNNAGARQIAQNLRNKKENIIIGGNIGKNKATPNDQALNDYLICFRELFDVVDYFVVNVSSPNTPGLRDLQDKGSLMTILHALMHENRRHSKPKPMLVKIAPDLTDMQLDDIVSIVHETGIAGVVATNTTISREGLLTEPSQIEKIGAGGLSGKPLTKRSTDVIRYLSQKSKKSFVIIGVGGIHSAEDAKEKLEAGADLVQVYTGFIYEGPGLAKKICKSLS